MALTVYHRTKLYGAQAGCGREDGSRFNLLLKRIDIMATGTVKWFNNKKGYGFITPDEGGQDVFVHISAVQKAGMRSLNEGAKINYELMSERGKTVAGDLKLEQ